MHPLPQSPAEAQSGRQMGVCLMVLSLTPHRVGQKRCSVRVNMHLAVMGLIQENGT